MTRYEIKSLSIGGILDQTVALVKDHFGVLLAIAAVVYVPYGLINGFIMMTMMPPAPTPPFEPGVAQEYQEAMLMAMLFVAPITMLFGFIGVPLTNGAMIWGVSRCYLGEKASVDDSWIHALRRAIPLIVTQLLYTLAMLGGFILCVIPMFIFMFWFIFYAHTTMLEGLNGTAALKRSKELMKGNMGKAFVLTLLVSLLSAVVGAIGAVIPQPHIAVVVQVAFQAVMVMFSAAALTVFYFSCRCDHEDFDLMRLAEAVEAHDGDDTIREGAL